MNHEHTFWYIDKNINKTSELFTNYTQSNVIKLHRSIKKEDYKYSDSVPECKM